VLDHIAAQVVADQLRVPVGGGQQPLHPIRGGLPGVLGQLPTVLTPDWANQPTQVRQHPPPWLGPGEAARDPGGQRLQPRRPPPDFLDRCPRPIGLRHGPGLLAVGAAGTIPAGGREPYLKTSAAGVLDVA
jgi:hypothetical protein